MKTSRAIACGLAFLMTLPCSFPLLASSTAIATGSATSDGRPVAWKNRDHWSTPDGWKVYAYHYTANGASFGSGDRYTARFNYLGLTAQGSSGLDPVTGATIPWSGANDRGLGLTQVAGHTLDSGFAQAHGYSISQDLVRGMSGGYLNHVVLSRCEHVDEVEQMLRDTNNGGGFPGTGTISTARNTSTIITVFDRYGNAAIFELDGDSFTRDNITTTYTQDGNGNYSATHNDDKDTTNPANGAYHGYDWRNNFSKVNWTKPNGFPYFRDTQLTEVVNDVVVNSGSTPDGIHDWEDSTSAVMRYPRTGFRMDDSHLKDYRFFIQKNVGSGGIGTLFDLETLSKNIGDLPASPTQKPTGYHVNRFVSTFGSVFTGVKSSDPYTGKLVAGWICLGEPTVGLFVPVFPYAAQLPSELADMYSAINTKRHLAYSYTNDDAVGYSDGRNIDHDIDTVAVAGPGGYYGEGGIQKYSFAIENWAFDQFDGFMTSLRTGSRTTTALQTDMRNWQANVIKTMKTFYVNSQWPNSYEAESWANSLSGTANRAASATMSWGGKVAGLGGSGNEVTFQKVRVDGAGTYKLNIHYAASATRTLNLKVNGGTATTLSFPSSGGTDVLAIKNITVDLDDGDNTLRFYYSSTSTPALDRIEILNPDVIVDNTDAGFTTAGSGWNSQTNVTGYYGSNYLSDGTTAADSSSKYARWTPTIPVAGLYKVYLRWTALGTRPDAAPVHIVHADGTDTSKVVNQQINGGQWVEMGTYRFDDGTAGSVKLLCTDAGYTIADAARFEKQL